MMSVEVMLLLVMMFIMFIVLPCAAISLSPSQEVSRNVKVIYRDRHATIIANNLETLNVGDMKNSTLTVQSKAVAPKEVEDVEHTTTTIDACNFNEIY